MTETMTITSRQNPRLKAALALKGRKGRREQSRFLAEGHRILTEVAQTEDGLLELWISEEADASSYAEVWIRYGKERGIPVFRLSGQLFSELSDTVVSQGIVGVVRMRQTGLDRYLDDGSFLGLLPDGIQDPGNLGTMIRTAEAMGFDFVLIPPGTTDPYGEKCVRATMGSLFHIPVVQLQNPDLELRLMKEQGYEIAGALLESSRPSTEAPFGERLLLAIGSEANGLTEEVKSQLSYSVHIPMRGKVESLNAAAAMAMLAYEISVSRHRHKERPINEAFMP